MKTYRSPTSKGRLSQTRCPLFAFPLLFTLVLPGQVEAQSLGIDPYAEKQLKASLDYLGNLNQFSVETHNTIEGVLDYGQKVQFDFKASLTVQRPGNLLAERHGDIVNQAWYFDGTSLTLHSTAENYFASTKAPDNINEMLDFAREWLGLIAPASDLLYSDVFPLMINNVYIATSLGKTDIGNKVCEHFAFSRPGVDFQLWIPAEGPPLPCKYVVTDKLSFAHPNTEVVMINWDLTPEITDSTFKFVAPKGALETEFMMLDASGNFVQTGQGE